MSDVLSHAQERVLRYGPVSEADGATRELWQRHRDRLMLTYCDGTRPAAWWCYEHPHLVCAFDRQASTLFEHNLLGAQERDRLMARWRDAFERCLRPGMTRRERIECIRFADVPRALFDRWFEEEAAALGLKRNAPARRGRGHVHSATIAGVPRPCNHSNSPTSS